MAKKSDLNIVVALLHDLTGDPVEMAGSLGAIAESNGADGKFDRNDAKEVAASAILNQSGNPLHKVYFELGAHPEIAEDIAEFAGEDITPTLLSGNIPAIRKLFFDYLKSKKIDVMGEGGQFEADLKTISVKIGDKTFDLLVAETDEEKERGLMDVEEMDSNEGMLFDYSDNPQEEISFWMKDTTIPLDIVFINEEGEVISVKRGTPNSEEPITENNVACVIEVNQNSGIQPGDETDLFDDEEQEKNINVNKLYIYGADGQVQGEIEAGARIFSRKNTKTLIKLAKRAYLSKSDIDYKRLGKKMFEYIKQQDNREPEYVES